jgi:NAD-dependent SIR2 family protein deacetylase
MNVENDFRDAAEAVKAADALLITAGAGMGVDSGMPDFRGAEGFWRRRVCCPAAHLTEEASPRH